MLDAMRTLGLSVVLLACGSDPQPPSSDAGADVDARAHDAGHDAALSANAVVGTVVNQLAFPLAGASLRIGSTVVTSDENGHFAIDDVPPTYDVLVWLDGNVLGEFSSYVGLTSRFPILTIDARAGWATSLAGSVAPAPTPAQFLGLALAAETPNALLTSVSPFHTKPDGSFFVSYENCWGDSAISSTAYAVVAQLQPSGLPQSIDGWGQAAFKMNVTASNVLPPITISSTPPQGSITAHVVVPPSLVEPSIAANFFVGTHAGFEFFASKTSDATFATLATQGTTVSVSTYAHRPLANPAPTFGSAYDASFAFRGQLAPSANATLNLPEPIGTLAPTDGATGVDVASTPLSWESATNVAYEVRITCFKDHLGIYEGKVFTHTNTATLPNDPTIGVIIASGADCHWDVIATGPAASVDDLVGGAWPPAKRFFSGETASDGFGLDTRNATFTSK